MSIIGDFMEDEELNEINGNTVYCNLFNEQMSVKENCSVCQHKIKYVEKLNMIKCEHVEK